MKISKRLVAVATCLMFGMTTMFAQDFTFGAKAGVNLATFTGDDTGDLSSRTAFHVGGIAEMSISEKFSIQGEVLYSAQGTKDSEGAVDFDVNIDYINVPIMAKYYVIEGLSIEAGPQVGFLLNAETDGGGTTVDIKDFTKSTDFGANFGLGYKLENGLNFGARYYLGLADITDGVGTENISNENAVFQISVGYFFK